MKNTRTVRLWGGFLLLLLLLIVFLIWNLFAGSVSLSASSIWEILHGAGEATQRRILLQIRLPRLLAAMILGGGVFCLLWDQIARTAFAPTEPSISSVTAVFGAPVVIYMMIHRKAG